MVSVCLGCEVRREVERLREENGRLKVELQGLRLELFGLKASRKRRVASGETHESRAKKLGPPEGHKGTSRGKPDRIDRRVVLRLRSCPHCDGSLRELRPRYRYAEDLLLPVRLVATEYMINQYYCRNCEKVVYPVVSELIDGCHFGVRFLLYVTYLRFVLNLPYNKIARLLDDAYRAGVGEGTLVEYVKKAARVFGPEYERIKREMREMNCVHYDDTGQRIDAGNMWLWVFIKQGGCPLPHQQ